jgi:hypothetical protein
VGEETLEILVVVCLTHRWTWRYIFFKEKKPGCGGVLAAISFNSASRLHVFPYKTLNSANSLQYHKRGPEY